MTEGDRSRNPAKTGETLLEHRSAMETLAYERRIAQQYLEVAEVMLIALDADARVTLINPAGCAILGYPEHEILGKDWFANFIEPENFEKVRRVFDQIIRGEVAPVRYFENVILRGDGDRRMVAWHNSVFRDPAGTIIGLFSSGEDITDRLRTEERLRQNEAFLSTIYENSQIGIFVVRVGDDGSYAMEGMNPAHERNVGLNQRQIVGKSLDDLTSIIGEEHIAFVKRLCDECVQKREILKTEIRVEEGSLEGCWLFKLTPIVDKDTGRVGQIVGSGVSITEMKQAEADILEKERRFRDIFHGVFEGILIADLKDKYFVMANRAICEMFGYTQQEMLALGVPDIHPEDKLPLVVDAFEKQMASEIRVASELPCLRKDGTVFYADVSAVRVEIDGVECALGSFRDVTERRQMMAQLAQVDRLVNMGLLAAGVAHEVNNPLSYVLHNLRNLETELPALLDAIQKTESDIGQQSGPDPTSRSATNNIPLTANKEVDGIRKRLKTAVEGAERIRDVTRTLGAFSKTGSTELVSASLVKVADNVLSMMQNEFRFRAKLIKEYESNLPHVRGSENRLSQVLLNLIINAIHAIDEGDLENNEVRVKIWAEQDMVCLRVTDTGQGISKANLPLLFEPFFTTKNIGQGSGLGLSISKTIVESYGGGIEVTSELGKGSEFTVRFPIQLKDEPGAKAEENTMIESNVRGRALIVDDEPCLLEAMEEMLDDCDTVLASSGAAAQAILETDRDFDVIVCDMMMSNVSGIELHTWLAQVHPGLAKRLVFVTGGAFISHAREYLDRHNNPWLEKPFSVKEFRNTIHNQITIAKKLRSG